jgi:hypothetical protein
MTTAIFRLEQSPVRSRYIHDHDPALTLARERYTWRIIVLVTPRHFNPGLSAIVGMQN